MRNWTARRVLHAVGVGVAVAATGFVVACGDDDDDETKSAEPTPARFLMTADSTGKDKLTLKIPKTVKAGLVLITLNNADTRPRAAQILRVVGDKTVDDVLKVVNSEQEEAPIPDWLQDGGGIGTVEPGELGTVTQNLAPGRYVVWDDEEGEGEGPSNDELGAKGEFTVTGEAVDAELPDVPATLTATDEGDKDYSFEFKGFKAGTNAVRFENTGKQLHHALLFPIAEGSTFADVEKAAKTGFEGGNGPPPIQFEKGVRTAVIDDGIEQNVELELPAGNYAVLCFIGDRKGSKSHLEKGMIDELVIK